jgi:glycyl-tRNA synthetase
MAEKVMEKIVALCKRRGFIYPGSEIYGGLANTYDYGPVGAELLRNLRNIWWKYFIQERDDVVGLDSSLISHHKIWEASGHVAGFADAMIDCKNCKARMRADHLIEDYYARDRKKMSGNTRGSIPIDSTGKGELIANFLSKEELKEVVEGLSPEELDKIINRHKDLVCPNCEKYNWTSVRKFNLLFPVQLGIVEGEQGQAYLRGETAQLIFTNFRNVADSTRVKLPFGIGQLGKSFRNEITPGNSIFRTIEFEQGEIEYFFDPEKEKWEDLFEDWKKSMWEFVTKKLGIKEEHLRWRMHEDKERSFYSKRTEDLEYKFPFGFKELWGLAYRTDYDLKKHMDLSKKDLQITDPHTGKKITPHVIEPALGINRLLLMVLVDAYTEEESRVVLRIHPNIAPYKIAVFPLLANKEQLVSTASKVFNGLKKDFMVTFDGRGNIGKRYLYQDEIGTPWCVTVDFQTLEDETVTIRDRDSTAQVRVPIKELTDYFQNKLNG